MIRPLPIDPLIPQILEAVQTSPQVVLTATPGAGKTTRLPAHLIRAVKGKIAVLEPRRMAAVAAARRVADENTWAMGGREVGYQVRFDSQVSDTTRLVFMTDALFLRRLIDDPELREFDLVVIDEFHERNLQQDLILGVIKELQELGREIKLMIMSATLDVEPLQDYLGASVHVDVPGKVFPLTLRYSSQAFSNRTDNDFYQRLVDAIFEAHRQTTGDILTFLPGLGEIRRTEDLLLAKGWRRPTFPLHGSLTLEEQTDVLREHSEPRLILSTNIAEASVTVSGVDYVIDTGLSKTTQVHLKSGFTRLDLGRISLFNTRQRAGRAAREKEGTCLKLWTRDEEVGFPLALAPECQRSDLSSALLLLAHLGVTDFKNFAWFETPPSPLLEMAESFLRNNGALDRQTRLTALGQRLLTFPVPPRWGSLLALSECIGGTDLAARVVALLQEKDFVRPGSAPGGDECDLTYRLKLSPPRGVTEGARQLNSLLKAKKGSYEETNQIATLCLLSQSDRLCRRRGDSERGVMVGGRGVRLSPESQVKTSEFFVALDAMDPPGQTESVVRLACGMNKAFVVQELGDRMKIHEEVVFDEKNGEFIMQKSRRFGDLEIDEPSRRRLTPEELGDRFIDIFVHRWPQLLQTDELLGSWMNRWAFFAEGLETNPLTPDFLRNALEMAAFGKTKMEDVSSSEILRTLESQLDSNLLRQFNQETPARFAAPSGVSHPIRYPKGEAPYIEIRLQELFGQPRTPLLGLQKLPLVFHLLAPNFRPVQVTRDLAGFWERAYIEVRKELRGRYPKHSWPEDPLTAIPVAKGRKPF